MKRWTVTQGIEWHCWGLAFTVSHWNDDGWQVHIKIGPWMLYLDWWGGSDA